MATRGAGFLITNGSVPGTESAGYQEAGRAANAGPADVVLAANGGLRKNGVSSDDQVAASLLRVTADDPEYRRQAAAEAAFWKEVHPLSLEAFENQPGGEEMERYQNLRFTGDPATDWIATIARWGTFRRGIILGVSSPKRETRILETNPHLQATLMDISAEAVERRAADLGKRFPGRLTSAAVDLNFLELPPNSFDLVVSSSTIHHVTNLEHLAFHINRALTPDGCFFLEDYVGEPRFDFTPEKRRLYDLLHNRQLARERGRTPGLTWIDASDLSPFCGVRSDEILDVFRRHLDEAQLRTACALTIPMARSRPVDFEQLLARAPKWKVVRSHIDQWLGIRRRFPIPPQFFEELKLVGDTAAEAGILRPGVAFVVYRKRRN